MRMKNCITILLAFSSTIFFLGCKKDNYPGGLPSGYISIFDIRNIYKSAPVKLSTSNMFGANRITGVVTSSIVGSNFPGGIITVQDNRRLGQIRGIAIQLEANSTGYNTGDSLDIMIDQAELKKVNGILQITGVKSSDIKLISSSNTIFIPLIKANQILAAPGSYESTLLTIARVGFDASYPAGTTYAGDKTINDGFGNLLLHTEPSATWANMPIPFSANYTGIILLKDSLPQLWPRKNEDITVLASTAPKVAPLIITGYLADPSGTDANYEYVQLMATKNIDFGTNKYSMVVTNNAGTATPTGFPVSGWATGGMRTYKINISSGSVTRGQYIYVGANKNIWGAGSTDISASFWISKAYATVAGDDFGTATTNLLANSGNAAGIAVFDLTAVTADTIPVDVLFYGGAGSLYSPGPPARGYRITNSDYYDLKNPSTLEAQPFFTMGSNQGKLSFAATANFSKLGGKYNTVTGRWTTARTLTGVPLTLSSTLVDIEGATTLEQ